MTRKMKVNIFTPSHDSSFLPEVYKSLKAQTSPDWEWIVLYNNGAVPVQFDDPRVKTHVLPVAPEWVGPLKAHACNLCSGDILLELDHDDLLTETAVEEVRDAFEKYPDVGFVYSNTIHASGDFKPVQRFDEAYGWLYRPWQNNGWSLDEHISFEPTPNAISRIWFAPHHLRAFRKDIYEQVGGYNKKMRILDDLDLMCRIYQQAPFHHIDKGLYIYRVHGQNTWLKYNAEIQENVYRIHDQYIEQLAVAWSKRNNLRCIELGGRFGTSQQFESVDLKDAQIICDLNEWWDFAQDGSVGVVRAYDVLEHLRDPIHTMKELYRVLAPGGYVLIQVPSTDGRGAFQDPMHVSFWNENSFAYYTRSDMAKYIDTPVRFQVMRLYTTEKNKEDVCWTVAHLVKLNGQRVPGIVSI